MAKSIFQQQDVWDETFQSNWPDIEHYGGVDRMSGQQVQENDMLYFTHLDDHGKTGAPSAFPPESPISTSSLSSPPSLWSEGSSPSSALPFLSSANEKAASEQSGPGNRKRASVKPAQPQTRAKASKTHSKQTIKSKAAITKNAIIAQWEAYTPEDIIATMRTLYPKTGTCSSQLSTLKSKLAGLPSPPPDSYLARLKLTKAEYKVLRKPASLSTAFEVASSPLEVVKKNNLPGIHLFDEWGVNGVSAFGTPPPGAQSHVATMVLENRCEGGKTKSMFHINESFQLLFRTSMATAIEFFRSTKKCYGSCLIPRIKLLLFELLDPEVQSVTKVLLCRTENNTEFPGHIIGMKDTDTLGHRMALTFYVMPLPNREGTQLTGGNADQDKLVLANAMENLCIEDLRVRVYHSDTNVPVFSLAHGGRMRSF